MAYIRKQKVFKVVFEEPHALAGLTLQTKGLSVKEFAAIGLRLSAVTDGAKDGTPEEQMAALPTISQAIDEVKEMFADALISWDMQEEDGTPTPATLEGVNLLDDDQFYTIVGEWLTAIGGVDEHLGKGSGSGESIPALSDLMEPLSVSQAS